MPEALQARERPSPSGASLGSRQVLSLATRQVRDYDDHKGSPLQK
jgi:hypothetical protein